MDNSFQKNCVILHDDCAAALDSGFGSAIDLTFLDPPFNQDKAYNACGDNLPQKSIGRGCAPSARKFMP